MTAKRYGVLPYLRGSGKNELVLVTSRTNRNWIFPKGRKISGKTRGGSALWEAFEEAGLIGEINEKKQIRVPIERDGKRMQLILYPMRVDKILKKWPESKIRKRILVSPQRAEKLIDCQGMRRSLKLWRKSI